MKILSKLENDILNLNYDRGNKKIYKWILLLGYIDCLEENNYEFNTLIDISILVDYILVYLEEEHLSTHLLGTSKEDLEIIKLKDSSYRTYINKIISRFRSMPMDKIMNDSNEYNFFQTDLPKSLNTRSIQDKPREFKIDIGINHEYRDQFILTIKKACRKRILEITNYDIALLDEIDPSSKYDSNIDDNTTVVTSKARKGQDVYRRKLLDKYNHRCALCSISGDYLLTASHAKPWRDCDSTHEKLSEHNGLLLCKNHDALFDKGYITINPLTYKVEYSARLDNFNLELIKSSIKREPNFNHDYKTEKYILYHYRNIFKQ